MSNFWPFRRSKKQRKQSRRTREQSRELLFEQLETRALLATTVASIQTLQNFNITSNVGEKPESKVWKQDGRWFGVFSDTVGTHVYRLDGNVWTKTLQISTDVGIMADVKTVGNVTHIFMEKDLDSKLASIQFVPGAVPTYQMWSQRPTLTSVPLATIVEAATIDIDTTGRMWVSYDEQISKIQVKYSDYPYTTFSSPIVIAPNVFFDDLSSIIALPGGKIGVMWSDQNAERFGFRVHVDGADPNTWSANEVPGGQSALNGVGGGMADDHINLAVATDGTLYAAVKTSYDIDPNPHIGILVRRPNGTWDNFYGFNDIAFGNATRPMIQLNEKTHTLFYSYDDDFNWVYRECSTITFACTPSQILLASGKNATSTKQIVDKDVVILTSGKGVSGGSQQRVDQIQRFELQHLL